MKTICQQIHSWLENKTNNCISPGCLLKAFDRPIIGCATAYDPLFVFIKHDIGSTFYWTPEEAFKLAYPEESVAAEELAVITWILPQTPHTMKTQAAKQTLPSVEWSCARHFQERPA